MSIVVKKFGGTSVGSIEKIRRIAEHIACEKQKGDDIVVVVSAMGKTTDSLFSLAYEITQTPNQREMDMLLTAGERITMALLSLSLQKLDIQSISFTGSQSGIITDNSHGNAKIMTINAFRILEELKKGKIVIVAGFQGVSHEKEITTLGRGGSDTTAVALASFLKAKKCEIFTDVNGVYQVDPKIDKNAKKLDKLTYEEMLYMSFMGSKVLHSRAAEFACKYKMPVEVKSSEDYREGTMIAEFKGNIMEKSTVKTMSHKENLIIFDVYITFEDIPLFKTEIFDIEVYTYDPKFMGMKSAKIYVEKKYKTQFIEELNIHKLDFKVDEKEYAVINLLGYRINRDIAFLKDLYSFLRKTCCEPINIKNQGIGVQLMVVQSEAEKVIKDLNKSYILDNEQKE